MSLADLCESLRNCQECRLASGRTQVVFGSGNPEASIMFVGEAPGFHEDKQGVPFVGAAGKLLTELLESVGLSRSQIYIANVIKCRPPGNRDPESDEVETCKPFLFQQIRLIKPHLVCSMGNFATQTLLERKVGITKVHGQSFELSEFRLFPLFHPWPRPCTTIVSANPPAPGRLPKIKTAPGCDGGSTTGARGSGQRPTRTNGSVFKSA